jgi:phenylacetate-CoA ligase
MAIHKDIFRFFNEATIAAKRRIHFEYCCGNAYRQMKRMDFLPLKEVKRLQERKLRELIRHCYKHVPYYQKLFKRLNLTPKDIQTIEDLKKLPILTKEEVIRNPGEFLANNISRSELKTGTTSGTTGTPFTYYYTHHEEHVLLAALRHERDIAGVKWADKMFNLDLELIGHKQINPLANKTKMRWNQQGEVLYINPMFLTKKHFHHIFDKMERSIPKLIKGNPSNLYPLARYGIKSGKQLKLNAVFSDGEILLHQHRKAFKKAFGCETYDKYGQKEMSIAAKECHAHNGMHLNPYFNITEITEKKIIIATPLFKKTFPLLRYSTQDIADLDYRTCSCGRTSPRITSIRGRHSGVLIGKEGTPMDDFTLYEVLKPLSGIIKGSKFKQKKDGNVDIFLTMMEGMSDKKKAYAIRKINVGLKKHFSIRFFISKKPLHTLNRQPRLIHSDIKTEYYNTN